MRINSEVRSDGLFRLYKTQQGQHVIFLDSTRLCLDSTAVHKEMIYQNS